MLADSDDFSKTKIRQYFQIISKYLHLLKYYITGYNTILNTFVKIKYAAKFILRKRIILNGLKAVLFCLLDPQGSVLALVLS